MGLPGRRQAAAGLVWFSQVDAGGSYVGDVLFPSLLAAVGLGLAFVSMTVAAVSGVETHEVGLASGLINTSQQIGGALGLAVLSTIAVNRTDDELAVLQGAPNPIQLADALVTGFKGAFFAAAVLLLAGLVLLLTLLKRSDEAQVDVDRPMSEIAA